MQLLRSRLYGEKGSRQDAHPLSRVNFTEHLYERKVDPSAQVNSWLCNENSARACSNLLSLTELTRLGEPKCLYGEKLARIGARPYHRKKGGGERPSFVRRCIKSWFAQGSSDRRVTLLPGTTFLHINGA